MNFSKIGSFLMIYSQELNIYSNRSYLSINRKLAKYVIKTSLHFFFIYVKI